jgi:hypothetical protein
MSIKAVYSIAELGKLMGLDRHQTTRLLEGAGVPMRPISGDPRSKRVVWLSDLRTHMAHAWDSIQERLVVEALAHRRR